MDTRYIGRIHAELNDENRSDAVEIQVDDSEVYDDRLRLGIHTIGTGREVVGLHLSVTRVQELSDALAAWLDAREGVN